VLSRWQGGLGALVITLVACALVILDLLQVLDPETRAAVRGDRAG
jgi:hypothetical protein